MKQQDRKKEKVSNKKELIHRNRSQRPHPLNDVWPMTVVRQKTVREREMCVCLTHVCLLWFSHRWTLKVEEKRTERKGRFTLFVQFHSWFHSLLPFILFSVCSLPLSSFTERNFVLFGASLSPLFRCLPQSFSTLPSVADSAHFQHQQSKRLKRTKKRRRRFRNKDSRRKERVRDETKVKEQRLKV